MDLQLTGKVAIVTGASKGIGRSIAQVLASEGMRVTVVARSRDELASLAAPLGDLCLVQAADLTDPSVPAAVVAATMERFGSLDVLVNNVGWTFDRLFVEKERTEWEREIQLNLWGMINCTRAVLDGMIARKAGAIVSMGSDAGRMGEFREGVYGACKAGVIALSKSLAREVGRHGIRLNVVCPGMTIPASEEDFGDRSMWAAEANRAFSAPDMQARIAKAYPLRRVGRPEDVAPAVLFLASAAAGFITGQTLSVSGGYTMM